MAGPWEKYAAPQQAAPAAGPWLKYGGSEPTAPEPAEKRETVVATTPDGGRVVRMESGALAFTSPGYSTTDPAKVAEIMKGATPAEVVQGDMDAQLLQEHPIAARVQEFNQGVPVVGEWLDEAVGAVSPKAKGGMRALSNAMERQNPVESAALNISGGLAYTLPVAAGAAGEKIADFVTRGGTALSRGLRGAAVASGLAGTEGAVSGAGRDDENRMRGAATYGGVGLAMGAFLGPVADMIGTGAVRLFRRFKGLDEATIAREFGISSDAARVVRDALSNDDLDGAVARLSSLGDDAMLADAGPATGALLDAASKTGGKALAVTREAVEGRARKVAGELSPEIDRILGVQSGGIKAAARDISQRSSAVRKAAYDRAYGQAINYADDTGRAIEGVLERVPEDNMRAAIKEANKAMRVDGVHNPQILADIADDGSVTFREMPNVQQLDEIKKALANIGREVDKFDRPTADSIRNRRLAGELSEAIANAVPAYRTAVKLGGDKIQSDTALDMGRKLLFRGTSAEDVTALMEKGLSREARNDLYRGLRESIETTMSNVRRTITDDSMDAREAMTALKEMSSRANIAKLRAVLGNTRAEALFKELDRQAAALALRSVVQRGSDTAIRQAIQSGVTKETAPGAVRRTLGNLGNPLDAAKTITQEIAGIDPASMTQAQKAMFAEIADALTRLKGPSAERALSVVRGAMNGQPIKDSDARLIGRLTATGIFQTGQSQQQLIVSRLPN